MAIPSNFTHFGGDIPDGSEATPGLWDRRFSNLSQNLDQLNSDVSTRQEVFNVKAFGAVGDGSADDITSFDNAATAADGGGIVFIPPGTYRLGSTWSLANRDVSIRGAGVRFSKIQSDGSAGITIETESNFYKDFAVEARNNSATTGIEVNPASSGAQNSLWQNVRVSGFSQGAGFAFYKSWEHTLIRCDAIDCNEGFRLGENSNASQVNDITLHSCNARRHTQDSCNIDRSSGAVSLFGGNFANGRNGIRVGNTFGVQIVGTYGESNDDWDVNLTSVARGFQVAIGAGFSPGGIKVDGVDGWISGGRLDSSNTGIQLGGGGETAARVLIKPFRWSGSGVSIDRQSATNVTIFTADALNFFGSTSDGGVGQQTVSGSRSNNTALENLLTALANYGLVVDNTTDT